MFINVFAPDNVSNAMTALNYVRVARTYVRVLFQKAKKKQRSIDNSVLPQSIVSTSSVQAGDFPFKESPLDFTDVYHWFFLVCKIVCKLDRRDKPQLRR